MYETNYDADRINGNNSEIKVAGQKRVRHTLFALPAIRTLRAYKINMYLLATNEKSHGN